jgi:hypothetical protein
MSTCFKRVLQGLDLKADACGSNAERSHMFVLLSECDRYELLDPQADVLTNPFAEVLRRLATSYRETFAFKALAKEIGMRAN